MTDRPAEPMPGAEPSDVQEGEPTAAPSPEGAPAQGFGDAAGEAPAQTEVEAQVEGDRVAGNDPGTAEEQGEEQREEQVEDTEVDELGAMKSSLADLTNDLQRLSAEYANYRRRVDRERQLVAENAAYKALTPVVEVLDTIDRAKEHGELEGGFKAVADQLERVVAGAGLVRFGEPGDAFDPTLHEALSHLGADPEVQVTTVKHVAKAGYRLGERVVRAAQVLVVDPVEG
ncbi:nucleotide exchange factor GrpE [Microbacterium sp. ARD31]|uniref:nucleotide exchange factor GrpE n=1 Tax=Microbacterium sp. ARD31 TaxID=2962576 RepID=UPI00288137D2|nr:nucleotide exchange factor GrpE [Microbacterium sp. ARD31]MDT0188093.1 nucleotide exchange factor GrpE [Microbacterium sp. ARD31]